MPFAVRFFSDDGDGDRVRLHDVVLSMACLVFSASAATAAAVKTRPKDGNDGENVVGKVVLPIGGSRRM